MGNQNGKVAQFRNLANQMLMMSTLNKRSGRYKNGEITRDQARELYVKFLPLCTNNYLGSFLASSSCRSFKNAYKPESDAGINISSNEQFDILMSFASDLGVDFEEVTKAIDKRDTELAKIKLEG